MTSGGFHGTLSLIYSKYKTYSDVSAGIVSDPFTITAIYFAILLEMQSELNSCVDLIFYMKALRPYQLECVSASLNAFKNENIKRMAVSLPVGSGKTVIFSNLLRSFSKTLVLAHRDELIQQAFHSIKYFNPRLNVSLEAAKHVGDLESDVIVASVASMSEKRLARYHPKQFDCIIIDEAHHAAASSYARILKYFESEKHDPESKTMVWGCSATLRRQDGRALSSAFDKIVYHKEFKEMIAEKYLCTLRVVAIKTTTDLKKVSSAHGDFKIPALSRVVNSPDRNNLIVNTWQVVKENPDCISWTCPLADSARPSFKFTLVFAVDVKHINDLVLAFNQRGINGIYRNLM